MDSRRRRKPAGTVDEYIRTAPGEMHKVLKDLRAAIREAAPKAEETISYQIPSYKYGGPVVFFAAFKEHISLYVPGKKTVKHFSRELRPYDVSGATIHFTVDNPPPSRLVKGIVRSRMKENEARAKRKH